MELKLVEISISFTINSRIFSTKYEDNYIPDMYYVSDTSYTRSDPVYAIKLGANVKSLSVGYIPLLDIGGKYSGSYYVSYFIYGQGLTSLDFRRQIV